MRVKITNWKKISASIFIIGAVFILLSLQTKAASESDAIAVRVMPNTNHDSIETWYAKQGFKGSPQSLIVDGYDAIRDGRTVFVNAANIDSSDWYKPTSESGTPAGRECKVKLAVNQGTGAVNCSLDLIGNPNTYAEEFLGTIAYGAYNTPYCATAQCPVMLNPNKCRWAEGIRAWSNQCSVRTNSTKIYTNIYLISYNQESEEKTLDILGQLVSHWKFNNNISDSGRCSISKLSCQADTDCPTNYICANANNSEASNPASFGKCILNASQTCLIDSDCPVNLFCDSLKARSIRDVNRLGKFNQITDAIESFKAANGKYPSLQSGTYVLGNSMSVWPSWKETLLPQLGLNQLLVDPINILGFCDGYDAATCWNNKINTFVNSNLSLPGGSYAFVYKAAANGINYALCSVFETKDLGYDTQDKKISSNSCSVNAIYGGNTSNTAPYVVSSYTDGESGKEFNGYVKVNDAEGDLISWNLGVSSPTSWTSNGWQSGTSLIPVLQDTGDANQKKIYAPRAGNPGSYDMNLVLTDSRGASTTTKLTIVISAAGKPKIEAEDVTYFADPVNPLNYTFSVEGSNSKPTYSIVPVNSNYTALFNQSLKSVNVVPVGLNKNKIDLSFLFSTSNKIDQDMVIPLIITAKADGMTSTKTINLNLKIEKPNLDFECENMARIGQYYPITGSPCVLGKQKSGNHTLSYSVSGLSGLNINYINNDYVSLKADSIIASAATDSTIKVKVVNEYGASAEKSFDLKINTFCGDGIKQTPNTEGRGGLNNDGVEACDGIGENSGISRGISISSDKQYGCTSALNIKSPYPILDNNSCVFKPADNGGGYCGDDICQFKIDDANMENCWNCRQDCGTCAATLESSADAEHIAYYDNKFVYKTTNINSPGATTTILVPGKNVFAFWAQDLNDTNYGLAFKLKTGAGSTIFQEFSTKAPLPVGSSLVCNFVSRASNLNTLSSNDYNPANGQGAFVDWTTADYNDSAWRQISANTDKDLFKGVPYIWPAGSHLNGDAIYCRLTFDYKPYNMDVCVPNCTNRTCGSDGCGGTCGTCGSDSFCNPRNYQCQLKCGRSECGPNSYDGASCGTCGAGAVCIDGLCPSSDTNIQICADNAHNSFFNNSNTATDGRVMSGTNWGNVEKFKVKLADQNIFAIEAIDWGGIHGVSATLNVKVGGVDKISLNTNNTTGWQCNRTATTGWKTDWNADSSWSNAISMNNKTNTSGNALASSTNAAAGISQIWLNDPKYPDINRAFSYTSDSKPDYVYCRYKFNVSDIKIPCVPNCTNKCGGFDGCSGYCYSACPTGQVCGGDPTKLNVCAVKK